MVVRLNFSLPEFVRIIWASERAQAVWEHRMQRVSTKWQELERIAVLRGLKPLALQTCTPEGFPDLVAWAAGHNLCAVPLRRELAMRVYSNASHTPGPGDPWTYRIVLGPNGAIKDFLKAWTAGDDLAIGEQLGFPKCCQAFFQTFWCVDKWRDLTYPMVKDDGEENNFTVKGPRGCNILLRWAGIRMVSHLPCRFNCAPTGTIGEQLFRLFQECFYEESLWLAEMIDWPVRWSSLHGVAIVTTPVMKIITSSDPLGEMVNVDREGRTYPAEGASGVDFPLQNVITLRSDNWSDNGFSDFKAMETAHSRLLEILARSWRPSINRIIDLGCGNGLLLSKISTNYPYLEISGIEHNTRRAERAGHRLKGFGKVTCGDLTETHIYDPPYGLMLISISRILEVHESEREQFIKFLAKATEYLLIYTYNEQNLSSVNWTSYFEPVDTASVHALLLRAKDAKK